MMSPSDTSSSDYERSEDGDNESSSCHGFSSPSPEVQHYEDIEQDPMYAVILHTIRKRQQLHERLTSTREDFQDDDDNVPEGAAAAPHPAIHEDVLHHMPTTPPPQQSATPGASPLHFELRSGAVKQGAPKKRGRGTKRRR